MKFIIVLLFTFMSFCTYGQILSSGTYLFSIRDAEYQGHPIVAKCKVIIEGEKIKVIYTDNTLSILKYGELFDEGILIIHKKTGQWIIGHSKKDADAKEVGGCSDGPRVIDLKERVLWNC
ncbi:hypothetical protein HNQ02_003280 [Flavobacterium sp. 7E]|uniref:hypothetical protein n=1 Tax=Flavobacterium sp. 7E TaxID=2735898 RepID=UPI00156FB4E0|nr:hypothetical protein [Flavobacterium sp. 7E]NRS90340.1 hypothetical protein [Flavobacterium sp. 7E]